MVAKTDMNITNTINNMSTMIAIAIPFIVIEFVTVDELDDVDVLTDGVLTVDVDVGDSWNVADLYERRESTGINPFVIGL